MSPAYAGNLRGNPDGKPSWWQRLKAAVARIFNR